MRDPGKRAFPSEPMDSLRISEPIRAEPHKVDSVSESVGGLSNDLSACAFGFDGPIGDLVSVIEGGEGRSPIGKGHGFEQEGLYLGRRSTKSRAGCVTHCSAGSSSDFLAAAFPALVFFFKATFAAGDGAGWVPTLLGPATDLLGDVPEDDASAAAGLALV